MISKLLIATIAIVAFALVSVYYVNQNTVTDPVPIVRVAPHQNVARDDAVYAFAGDEYLCSDGSKIYTDINDGDVIMALVYRDGTYGIAEMSRQDDGVTYTDAQEQNTLTILDDKATFTINHVTIKEDCLRQ